MTGLGTSSKSATLVSEGNLCRCAQSRYRLGNPTHDWRKLLWRNLQPFRNGDFHLSRPLEIGVGNNPA